MKKKISDSHIQKEDFKGLGIAESIMDVLGKLNINIPTPIQRQSIPAAIAGQDLVGIAQTGTGKTFAFGIPMIQRLALYKGRGLILLPTRELALQVEENLQKIGRVFGLRTAALIGGASINLQLAALRKKPHIIVATPGRLIDLIQNRNFKLDDVKILVLDEADMMFDMGFAPQIETILAKVPKQRQTLLFSATMPETIIKLSASHMSLPLKVEVAPAGTAAENVEQEMHIIRKEDKLEHLQKLLSAESGSVLIFSRTRHGAKSLAKSIKIMGHSSAEIHSDRSLGQRREALSGFKSGRFRVLVATDIAARGIDVSGIALVVNYDLPESSEDYVHRIGRTGRAGQAGKAVSFAAPSQGKEIRAIEKLINKTIPLTRLAELEHARPVKAAAGKRQGNRFNANRRPARGKVHAEKNKKSAGPRRRAEKSQDFAAPMNDRQRFWSKMKNRTR